MEGSGKTAPLFSIIVPLHNSLRFLEGCVESAVRAARTADPSGEDYELLLVDDGSDDGSLSLCEKMASGNPRIRVFSMEDRGVSAARNLGLENARGGLICFLDADDRLFPEMLKELSALLDRTGADIAGCGFAAGGDYDGLLSESAKPAGTDVSGTEKAEGPEEPAAGLSFVKNRLLQRDTHVWAKLYRREALAGHRFPEGMTIGEDMLFLLDLAADGKTFARMEKPLYFYFRNPQGAMERPYTPSFYDQIRCWEEAEKKIFTAFPEAGQDPALKGRLLEIRTVSAVLVASRIAGTEKKPGEAGRGVPDFAEDFEKARTEALLQEDRMKKEGCARRLSLPYRLKLFLLRYFPKTFRGLQSR